MPIDEGQAASESRVMTFEGLGGPFVSVVEQTRMPIVFVDPHLAGHPIVFANDAFLRLTGYERSEVLGRPSQMLMAKTSGMDVQRQIQITLNDGFEGSLDVRYVRKDGSAFWASIFIGPVLGEDGRIAHYYLSFLDVTRRRETDLMLDELHHRVKNALMVVQAIAAATLRRPEVREERILLEGRLMAMAETYSMLARRKWESVDLAISSSGS